MTYKTYEVLKAIAKAHHMRKLWQLLDKVKEQGLQDLEVAIYRQLQDVKLSLSCNIDPFFKYVGERLEPGETEDDKKRSKWKPYANKRKVKSNPRLHPKPGSRNKSLKWASGKPLAEGPADQEALSNTAQAQQETATAADREVSPPEEHGSTSTDQSPLGDTGGET